MKIYEGRRSNLKSKIAIAVNIKIIRIFTKLRQLLSDNLSTQLEIENIKKKITNNTKNIELVFTYLDELIAEKGQKKTPTKIGYKK